MRLHQVKQFCCGCSLETGSKIIAWLQIIISAMVTILCIVQMFYSFPSENWDFMIGEVFIYYLSTGLYILGFGVVLLTGIKKKRPDYINIWIFFFVFCIFVYILNLLLELFVAICYGNLSAIAILGVSTMLILALDYYCLVVVYSLRKEMMAPNHPELLQEV